MSSTSGAMKTNLTHNTCSTIICYSQHSTNCSNSEQYRHPLLSPICNNNSFPQPANKCKKRKTVHKKYSQTGLRYLSIVSCEL